MAWEERAVSSAERSWAQECGALQGLGSLAGGLPSNGVWAQLFFLLVTSLTSELTTVKDRVPALFALASNVSQATGLEPLSLMLPAAAASEFNFMMPSSGARNAIIFEIAYISSLEMILPGIVMKLVSCVFFLGVINSAGRLVLGQQVLELVNATAAAKENLSARADLFHTFANKLD
ncbi:unnamed protein product [Ixodes pacificus]